MHWPLFRHGMVAFRHSPVQFLLIPCSSLTFPSRSRGTPFIRNPRRHPKKGRCVRLAEPNTRNTYQNTSSVPVHLHSKLRGNAVNGLSVMPVLNSKFLRSPQATYPLEEDLWTSWWRTSDLGSASQPKADNQPWYVPVSHWSQPERSATHCRWVAQGSVVSHSGCHHQPWI